MSEAVRVGDLTAHGVPLQGSGSPDVFIGGQKAWRAMPKGAGDGLDEASNDTKAIMDVQPTPATAFAPPSVIPKAAKIEATMMKVAAQVEKALGVCGPSGGVTAAFATLKATTITLTTIYTSAAAVPGGEPGARVAFTMGYQQALSAAMGAAVSSLAGDWDMHSCPQATPAAHGPGFVIQACKTIFINKRPAVVKGHKVVEAAGGSAPVNIGCGTVFFGDKAPGQTESETSSETSDFPDDSGLAGGPVIDPASGQPVLLAVNAIVPGLLLADASPSEPAPSGPSPKDPEFHPEIALAAVEIALKEAAAGVFEENNENRGPRIDEYQMVNRTLGQAWCAKFAYWCFQQAANDLKTANPFPRIFAAGALEKWGQREGRIVTVPQRGDILVHNHNHAGIVTGPALSSGVVPSVEGNTWDRSGRHGVYVLKKKKVCECSFIRL